MGIHSTKNKKMGIHSTKDHKTISCGLWCLKQKINTTYGEDVPRNRMKTYVLLIFLLKKYLPYSQNECNIE